MVKVLQYFNNLYFTYTNILKNQYMFIENTYLNEN